MRDGGRFWRSSKKNLRIEDAIGDLSQLLYASYLRDREKYKRSDGDAIKGYTNRT